VPDFPRMFRVRQNFPTQQVDDVAAEVDRQLARLDLARRVKPGETVAVTAGSRGVANIATILRTTLDHFRRLRAEPFLVPAMGSHGGGTAEGQLEVLASYGITEQSMGCPIRASMETVVVGQTEEGLPVHFDRHAFEADHVVVCNRVKPHTRFAGPIESGLMKMMLIGLGKKNGAEVYHRAIVDYSFAQIIRSVADKVLANCGILAGLAVIENAHDETARIEAMLPEDFEAREVELLEVAKQGMARLPFDRIDLLLIDRIGKNISGTGLDTNVVGRKFDDHKPVDGESPRVKLIAIRGLTPETHGNAVGMGIAEFCKSDLLRETDIAATRLNAITAKHVSAAMAPLDYETDREILEAALPSTPEERLRARLLWIANTLHLRELECSEAYWQEAEDREDLEILTDLRELPLGKDGHLSWIDEQ
jgi:antitoxin (DNA-binding transcriptional repressor) of toxin-antitoxin stability system